VKRGGKRRWREERAVVQDLIEWKVRRERQRERCWAIPFRINTGKEKGGNSRRGSKLKGSEGSRVRNGVRG
jgi:hypothetical protein